MHLGEILIFLHTHLLLLKDVVLDTNLLALLVRHLNLRPLVWYKASLYANWTELDSLGGEESGIYNLKESSPDDSNTGGLHTGVWDPVVWRKV